MTLDATLSGEFANSYVTRSYADSYFANHYVADKTALWATFSDAQKDALLIHATIFGIENVVCVLPNEINDPFRKHYSNRVTGQVIQLADDPYLPYRYSSIQNLQFPRNLDIDSTGTVFIPEDVKIAQCEQAIYLADQDEEALSNSEKGLKLESITVGPIKISEEFETKKVVSSISSIVKQLMKKYSIRGTIGSPIYRG